MFVEGVNVLRAVSVYNGRTLWEYPLEGILRPYHQDHLTGVASTGSNYCLGPERVYLHTGDRCLVLDAASGRKAAEFPAPPQPDGSPGTWGHIAWRDGTLFGSLANPRHQVKESWRSYRGRLDMSRLLGESVMTIELGGTLTDPGATAWDEKDGDIPRTSRSAAMSSTPWIRAR